MSHIQIDIRSTSIRAMLLKELAAVTSRMNAIAKDALEVDLDGDGIPASSWGQDQALTETLDTRLNTIESALERLDAGSYGLCADCKAPIPARRLEALPFATLCVKCQSLADKKSRALVH